MSKYLIYIEPHPIRNSMSMYCNVFNFFKQFVQVNGSDEARYYSNREALEKAINLIPEIKDKCIFPSIEDEAFFSSQLVDWDREGIFLWNKLMDCDSAVANQYVDIIVKLHAEYEFDYIICWGTNGATQKAAKMLDVGFVDMELGCSRTPYLDTIVMDPWGVNGASAISNASINDFKNIKFADGYDDLLNFGFEHSSLAFEELFRYVPLSQFRSLLDKKEKIAFIPLQLYDDANLLKFSSYERVLDFLVDILPKLAKEGYICIIKEHPGSFKRNGAQQANEQAKKYANNFSNVIWMSEESMKISNTFLFQIADVIVTINSSTGFESLFFEKPVVILGKAVYKVSGVFPTLSEYLSGSFDYNEYKKNIGKIRSFFYRYYLLDISIFDQPKKFLEKVKKVGDLSKKDLNVGEIVQWYIENNFANGAT